MQRTPLWEMPGFIACGPDQPMTDAQRAIVFGDRFDRFMNHLADVVTSATSPATLESNRADEPRCGSFEPRLNHTPKPEAMSHARHSA